MGNNKLTINTIKGCFSTLPEWVEEIIFYKCGVIAYSGHGKIGYLDDDFKPLETDYRRGCWI